MNSDNQAISDLIMARMQRLMCLGFEGQPAADLIEGTARIWVEKLDGYDPSRLIAAFDAIEESRQSRRFDGGGWPSPGDVIRALPTYKHAYQSAPQVPEERRVAPDPQAQERIREMAHKAIEDCAKKLGVAP
jgi:hypothetical protein